MKKLFLTLGLASLFMVACNNTPKQQETETPAPAKTETCKEKHECPMSQLKQDFAKWDEMDDAMKAELNTKAIAMFAEMDAKMAEMKAEGKGCAKECEKKCEKKCAEMKAECEAMKAAWENIANLSADEQKDLIMKRIEGMKKCHHSEKGCCKGDKEGCCKDKHEGCQGKHESCQHPK